MSCFSCFSPHRKDVSKVENDYGTRSSGSGRGKASSDDAEIGRGKGKGKAGNGPKNSAARSFTFRELAAATRGFREVNLIGEGGFGRVYKGRLESGQVVAIKQLNHDGLQGFQEFIVEETAWWFLKTFQIAIGKPFLASIMFLTNVHFLLSDLEADKEPLSWDTRIKIAVGAARGLEYLHCKANPPSRPFLKDRRKFVLLVDPLLQGRFPVRCLHHAIAITAMCLQEQPTFRPLIGDIVVALEYLASQSYKPERYKDGVRDAPSASPSQENKDVFTRKSDRRSSLSI
ncbi:hypothetical protein FEM48_Zijuj06G0007100 [Ziziphus jujuba var. spinosa]|uniref:Protein kinase domain-containing protein n=1 Tax=Ziziphus jujuba var. spinosa TaxID=714518 RepID=A0A978V665_ZIZJJ|nr:hypothetical protein FEM48_Zijuj06G0007100 [Ziziphus jujuba var. spinosa]